MPNDERVPQRATHNHTHTMTSVDLREAHGADSTGDTPINDLLETVAQEDDVEIVLPRGRYLLDDRVLVDGNADVTIRGSPHATLVVERRFAGPILGIGWAGEEPGTVTVEDLTLDVRADGVGQRPLALFAKWNLDVANVSVRGRRDAMDDNINTVNLGVTRESGRGTVRNLRLPSGGEWMGRERQTKEFVGVNVEPGTHEGTLTLRDCYVQGFANNSYYLYRDSTGGTVRLVDCVAADGGLSAFRTDKDDVCVGCKASIDVAGKPYDGAIGIWPQGGGTFRECTIERESGENKLIMDVRADETARLENIDVLNRGNGDIMDWRSDAGHMVVDGLTVRDENDDGDENDYYTSRIRRGNVTLRNVDYRTQGDQRRGIYFEGGDRIRVRNSRFDVDGPVAMEFEDCGEDVDLDDANEYGDADVRR